MTDDPEIATIFEGDCPLFELKGRPNGFTSWSARAFAEYLGYKDYKAFKQALNRAQQVLISLEVDLSEHFKQEPVIDASGGALMDIRLSRFACYLVAMNGDPKKKQVARAQVYFARYSEECQRFIDDAEQLERVLVRDELSEHEKTLSHTAKQAGVTSHAYFQNAGYRGLYSMNLAELKKLKSIPRGRSALDFMGKDELAANLFRITQTDAKIKADRVRGQSALEATAENVGKKVRKTMHEISGQRPENLRAQEDIKKVKEELKSAGQVIKTPIRRNSKEISPTFKSIISRLPRNWIDSVATYDRIPRVTEGSPCRQKFALMSTIYLRADGAFKSQAPFLA